MSTFGKVFFGKESKKPSEEKPVEKPSEEKPVEKTSEEKPVEKPSGEKLNEQPHPKPKPKNIRFHCGYCGRDGHRYEYCFKRRREERMANEWANKGKYHPSNDVLEPRVQMPRAKASVRTVLAWGERKAAGGVAGRATLVRPVCHTGQTGVGLGRQGAGFSARDESRLGSGGRGFGGWSGKLAGAQFARRSHPRAQYEDGRSRSFEMERRNGPRSSFRGFCPTPVREGWFPHSGYHGGVRGGSFDRRNVLDCANTTLEQMAQHWSYSFCTNPSAESFVHPRAHF
jgi:hypothetical protein